MIHLCDKMPDPCSGLSNILIVIEVDFFLFEGSDEAFGVSVIRTVDDRRSTHEQSYGGRLPGFMRTNPTGSTGQDQEVSTPQATGSDSQDTGSDPQATGSEGSNQDSNQGTETEQKK